MRASLAIASLSMTGAKYYQIGILSPDIVRLIGILSPDIRRRVATPITPCPQISLSPDICENGADPQNAPLGNMAIDQRARESRSAIALNRKQHTFQKQRRRSPVMPKVDQ